MKASKSYILKLTWDFGSKGVPTALKDPLNKKRKVRLIRVEAYFNSYFADSRRVTLGMVLRGATGAVKERNVNKLYIAYNSIHQLFYHGVTEWGCSRGTAFISPSFAMRSDTSWLDAAHDGLRDIKATLGVKANFPEPRLYGNTRRVMKAFFQGVV